MKATKSKAWLCFALIKNLTLSLCILLLHTAVFSQQDTIRQTPGYDSLQKNYDSATNKLFSIIKKFGVDEQRRNAKQYHEDTVATKQGEIIERIRALMSDAKNYLQSGLDTSGLGTELHKIDHWYQITSDGVFVNTGSIQTHRNLETSHKIMRELLTRTLERKSTLDDYYRNLASLRNTMDSLYKDSILYKFSSDSSVLKRYVEKIVVVSQEIKPIDSSVKKTLASVSELQMTVNKFVNQLNASIEQINIFQRELANRTFSRETTNLTGPVKYNRRFNEIISFSMIKGALALRFYAGNEMGRIVLLLILVIASTILLVILKRKLLSQNMLNVGGQNQQVLKYPLLSSLVIVLNLWQFILADPPFIFNALIWIISAVCVTIIFKNSITKYWMLMWLIMFVFFLLAVADNLLLQASRQERWIMLGLSIAGMICGSIIILFGRKKDLKEKLLIYFIGFVVLMQIVSIFTNIYGRYNLSKTCLTAGFFNVVIAILFFWTLRFINQTLSLATKAYSVPGKRLFHINFERLGGKAPPIFNVLLIAGWFVLFARNFYASRFISVPMINFIWQKRIIGEFTFTIGSILEFFLILYLSGLTSRMVSFFVSDTRTRDDHHRRKGGIGSWLLTIRISIVTIGLLLAFAAIGVPMDRLTIILSALSVGLGFGLQSLVNNLVSGLIISFEKPVNVGDIVDIAGHSGTVESIGFRSSIIATPFGSEVVIPNGDLLNQHLVNWTHKNNFRWVEIILSVAFGTNLEKVIKILKELPGKDERILKSPPPNVIVMQYNSSSIELQLTFWAKNIRQWLVVKSDIILAIDAAFKANGIEIPYPQQDIHIRSVAKNETKVKEEVENNQ